MPGAVAFVLGPHAKVVLLSFFSWGFLSLSMASLEQGE